MTDQPQPPPFKLPSDECPQCGWELCPPRVWHAPDSQLCLENQLHASHRQLASLRSELEQARRERDDHAKMAAELDNDNNQLRAQFGAMRKERDEALRLMQPGHVCRKCRQWFPNAELQDHGGHDDGVQYHPDYYCEPCLAAVLAALADKGGGE